MKAVQTLSLSLKILLIPLIGTVGFSFYLSYAWFNADHTRALVESVQFIEVPVLEAATNMTNSVVRIQDLLNVAVTTGDEDMLDQAGVLSRDMTDAIGQIVELDASLKGQSEQLLSRYRVWYEHANRLSLSIIDGSADFARLQHHAEKLAADYQQISQGIREFQQSRKAALEEKISQSLSSTQQSLTVGTAIGIVMVLCLFAVAIPVATSIKSSVVAVIRSLKNIASEDGDLTVRIESKSQDEIGELTYWFNEFICRLQNIVKELIDASLPIGELTEKLNNLALEAKSSMTEQALASSELTNAVREMNLSMESIATMASRTAEDTHDALKKAASGKEIVNDTLSGIQGLSENLLKTSEVIVQLESDSSQVSVVLDVIKSIAEQTNLLALNAAIEAARAGEQGRGFAVVADEVRTLASRTQQSTDEIHQTIEKLQSAARDAVSVMESSSSHVRDSLSSATTAGSSLNSIDKSMTNIKGQNDEIAVATEQQQAVSGTISRNISDIDKQTRQTSENTAELVQMSAQLTQTGSYLNKIVAQFKV